MLNNRCGMLIVITVIQSILSHYVGKSSVMKPLSWHSVGDLIRPGICCGAYYACLV